MMTDAVKELFNRHTDTSWDIPLNDKTIPVILKSLPEGKQQYLKDRIRAMNSLAGKSFAGLDLIDRRKKATSYSGKLGPIFDFLDNFVLPEYAGISTVVKGDHIYRCIVRIHNTADTPQCEVGFFLAGPMDDMGYFAPIEPVDTIEEADAELLSEKFGISFAPKEVEIFCMLVKEALASVYLSIQGIKLLYLTDGDQ